MDKVYFISDLDRTIIHSKNKGFRCVELLEDREITYMTDESYAKMLRLLENKEVEFVPCTMRNIKQTLRVDFIREYDPKIIICTNGAQIYINGKLDLYWDQFVKSHIGINSVKEDIEYIKSLNLSYEEIRNTEGFYVTIKCFNIEEAINNFNVLKDKFRDEIEVINIGIKIFIIDKRINKLRAVDYIIDKYKIEKLYTAGDSTADKEFTKRGISILPAHSNFKHENSIITKNKGIHSTEEIIDYIASVLYNNGK